MKLKYLVALFIVALLIISNPATPALAVSTDFEAFPVGTLAADVNVAGASFSGNTWQIYDYGTTYAPHVSGYALGGDDTLTISFNSPQKNLHFGYVTCSTFTATGYLNGNPVTASSYSSGGCGVDGYALVSSNVGFDTVIITGLFLSMGIDNLSTAVPQLAPQAGMISINTAQAQPVYESAGGDVVRDTSGNEIWLPQDYDGSGADTHLVMSSIDIDGRTWYQIFIGDGANLVWVPADKVTVVE